MYSCDVTSIQMPGPRDIKIRKRHEITNYFSPNYFAKAVAFFLEENKVKQNIKQRFIPTQ